MGMVNIGMEGWQEARQAVRKVLSEKGCNNYTACCVCMCVVQDVLEDVGANQSLRNEIVERFLRSMGYTWPEEPPGGPHDRAER